MVRGFYFNDYTINGDSIKFDLNDRITELAREASDKIDKALEPVVADILRQRGWIVVPPEDPVTIARDNAQIMAAHHNARINPDGYTPADDLP